MPKGCRIAAAAGAGPGTAAGAAGASRERGSEGIKQAPAEDAALVHAGGRGAMIYVHSSRPSLGSKPLAETWPRLAQ